MAPRTYRHKPSPLVRARDAETTTRPAWEDRRRAENRIPASRGDSKADPRPQLKSPRAAGAEDLCGARAGLAELRWVGEVAAVPDEVSCIEQVEDFADSTVAA